MAFLDLARELTKLAFANLWEAQTDWIFQRRAHHREAARETRKLNGATRKQKNRQDREWRRDNRTHVNSYERRKRLEMTPEKKVEYNLKHRKTAAYMRDYRARRKLEKEL